MQIPISANLDPRLQQTMANQETHYNRLNVQKVNFTKALCDCYCNQQAGKSARG